MLKAVVFDMDGVLIDSEPFWRLAQITAFAEVGVVLSEADLDYTMGMRVNQIVAHWFHERPWQGASLAEVEQAITKNVIQLVTSEGAPLPGVLQMLELLEQAGLRKAVASSSSAEIISVVLTSLGISQHFEFFHSAERETHGKPHPAVYISTVERLGFEPHECLAIEDSPTGVLAAKSARMPCLAVPDIQFSSHPYLHIADLVLNSLEKFDAAALKNFS